MSAPTPLLQPSGSNAAAQALDNLIRRELRVGDPSDPRQVAQALMTRYGSTPAARSLVNEAKGLPFLQTAALTPAPVAAATATSLDLQQAKADIEADLGELLGSNQLKDITPELEGWAQAIRAAVAEGERSAGLGIDTRQRDKTFGVRRQLGDYARAARLVGSFNARSRAEFRSLAQSLDEASAVLLVMMGESIANTGIAGGRYLLQVPYTELQSRREAVLYALRNLNGAAQSSYGPNEWPRGIDAYRQLFRALEAQGQGDLRSLLTEAEMSRVMDELIDRAGHGVAGLRALGATAQIDLQRFQRLIATIAWSASDPESPALTALHEALQLFIDGFQSTGGIRLVHIARPTILMYGLYGGEDATMAEERLQALLRRRGSLAVKLDCLGACDGGLKALQTQVLLDKALYDVDRAIDLYAVGDSERGAPELRAAAYGQVMVSILKKVLQLSAGVAAGDRIESLLLELSQILWPVGGTHWEANTANEFDLARMGNLVLPNSANRPLMELLLTELCIQQQQESLLAKVVDQMKDGCADRGLIFDPAGRIAVVSQVLADTQSRITNGMTVEFVQRCDMEPDMPSTLETSSDGRAYARLSNGRRVALDLSGMAALFPQHP